MESDGTLQNASFAEVIDQVVEMAGLTLNVYGVALILLTVTGVIPSVYVTLQGAVPVNAILTGVDVPSHIPVVPLMVALGSGCTVSHIKSPSVSSLQPERPSVSTTVVPTSAALGVYVGAKIFGLLNVPVPEVSHVIVL
jgi:hypothetical protein